MQIADSVCESKIEQNMPQNAVKLGDLLIRSGILTSQQLLESIELAKQTGTPIGRMLVMCGAVSENVLHGSVQIQSMLRENQLDLESGINLLMLVAKEDIPLQEALIRTGSKVEPKKSTVKLGELLVEGGFLLPDELDKFLADSADAGLPLGRIILLYGTISKESLSACLTAQVLVRDGKVSRENAIKALQTMRRRRVDLESSLRELGFYRMPLRPHTLIGELPDRFRRSLLPTAGGTPQSKADPEALPAHRHWRQRRATHATSRSRTRKHLELRQQ